MKKPEFSKDIGIPIPLKRPAMTAEPSILSRKLKSEDLFLIFASDGLWEQLTDEEAVQIVFRNPRAVSPCIFLFSINCFLVFVNAFCLNLIQLFLAGNSEEIGKSSPAGSGQEKGDEI